MLTRRRYEQRSSFTMPGLGARWRISVTGSSYVFVRDRHYGPFDGADV